MSGVASTRTYEHSSLGAEGLWLGCVRSRGVRYTLFGLLWRALGRAVSKRVDLSL